MKKLSLLIVLSLFAGAAVAQQSLGDVARKNRAKKHDSATTKLDDDSFARNPSPSTEPAAKAENKDEAARDAKKTSAPAQPKGDDLKKQIESQKKEIATLQREVDVAEREARLRAAAYYADAGVMLRDQAKFAEDSRKEQSEIGGKKQALEAAQQKLSDLQEQARKAGLPSE
ncbi:MAG TPA: hypothetical protein VE133_05425 [Candidatus Sulfotelmatobacter sp.]|nr:hypothetical protein [Candidatus Sulfotelmatobacter sp.]